MSLYLKYRPPSLRQVKGNQAALKVLDEMLNDSKTCPHVFLLHGPTGCGKTTIARIIAKRLGSKGSDLKEIDSAQFRGIDTAREIRSHSQYMPIESDCRVWIIDECFAKDTLIKTPNGDVPIQDVEIGDTVFSLAGKDKVANVFQNKIPLNRVVRIALSNGSVIICSKDHLFFTENKWQKACDLEKNTLILPFVSKLMYNINSQKDERNETLSYLRGTNGLLPKQTRKVQQKVLQSELFGKMEYKSSRNEKSSVQRKSEKKNIHWEKAISNEHRGGTKTSGILFKQDERKQSFLAGKKFAESKTNKADQWDIACLERRTRRQWEINSSSDFISHCFRMENGSANKNKSFPFGQIRVSSELQSGYRMPKIKNSNRSGWESSFLEERYRIGCKKDEKIKPIGVESVEIYQRGNNEQSFSSVIGYKERNQGYVILYDLQIHNHPSYFANGVAVHNCHKMTNDAQNGLLKILEDTPSHVYFVLCTTEPQKLLPTIRGRCSTVQVHPLEEQEMLEVLKRVVKREKQELETEVYESIIRDSLGLPRNALQILDQVLRVAPEERLKIAQRTAEEQSQSIELCRALMKRATWKQISTILNGLKGQDAESVRRVVLGYCQSTLLRGDVLLAGRIMEEFINPFYDSGFPQLVFACYSVTKNK